MVVTKVEAERFLRLIEEMGEERNKRYGWIAQVARIIGVHRSTLVKVLHGERAVTTMHLERAQVALNLPREYFSAADDDRHYREWAKPRGIVEFDVSGAMLDIARENLERTIREARDATERLREAATDTAEAEALVDLLQSVVGRVKLLHAYEVVRRLHQQKGKPSKTQLEHAAFTLVHELEDLAFLLKVAPGRRTDGGKR